MRQAIIGNGKTYVDDNIDRIIWLAAINCQEDGTNYFYMGE